MKFYTLTKGNKDNYNICITSRLKNHCYNAKISLKKGAGLLTRKTKNRATFQYEFGAHTKTNCTLRIVRSASLYLNAHCKNWFWQLKDCVAALHSVVSHTELQNYKKKSKINMKFIDQINKSIKVISLIALKNICNPHCVCKSGAFDWRDCTFCAKRFNVAWTIDYLT